MVQAIRQRSAYGGRTTGPVNAAFLTSASAFSVATNVFNPGYTLLGVTFSEGNARGAWTTTAVAILVVPKQYGKWACEVQVVAVASAGTTRIGVRNALAIPAYTSALGGIAGDYSYLSDGQSQSSGGFAAYGATFTTGDIITILWDADAGSISFAKNGVSQGVAFSGIPQASIPAIYSGTGAATQDIRISTTLTYIFPGFLQWR